MLKESVVTSASPRIEAYVLRFVFDTPETAGDFARASNSFPETTPAIGWHGIVIHVQTNQEKHFANIADALAFIARDVQLGDFVFHPAIQGMKDETRQSSCHHHGWRGGHWQSDG
jgi:hypothetical protein